MKTLITILLLLSACGRVPAPDTTTTDGGAGTSVATASPTPTPTPTPVSVTVISFPYNTHDYTGICNALRSWVPATQTIQFPININSLFNYSFESTGVFIIDGSGNRSVAGNTTTNNGQCTWVVHAGQFVSVTP